MSSLDDAPGLREAFYEQWKLMLGDDFERVIEDETWVAIGLESKSPRVRQAAFGIMIHKWRSTAQHTDRLVAIASSSEDVPSRAQAVQALGICFSNPLPRRPEVAQVLVGLVRSTMQEPELCKWCYASLLTLLGEGSFQLRIGRVKVPEDIDSAVLDRASNL